MKIRLRTKRMPWRALSPNLWHPSDGLNLPLDWSRITYLVPKSLYDPAVLWEAATKKLHSVSNVFNNRLFFATVLLVDILEFLMSKHNLLFHKEWTQNRNSQNQNKLVTRFGRQLLLFRLTLTNQKAVFTEQFKSALSLVPHNQIMRVKHLKTIHGYTGILTLPLFWSLVLSCFDFEMPVRISLMHCVEMGWDESWRMSCLMPKDCVKINSKGVHITLPKKILLCPINWGA